MNAIQRTLRPASVKKTARPRGIRAFMMLSLLRAAPWSGPSLDARPKFAGELIDEPRGWPLGGGARAGNSNDPTGTAADRKANRWLSQARACREGRAGPEFFEIRRSAAGSWRLQTLRDALGPLIARQVGSDSGFHPRPEVGWQDDSCCRGPVEQTTPNMILGCRVRVECNQHEVTEQLDR